VRFAFALDANVVQHLAVTLLSLFEIHCEVDIEVLFILVGVSEKDVDRLAALCGRFSNVTAHFKPFAIEQAHKFPISGHISLAAYARVFLANIVPTNWSRVIYLDCDLIVRRNFSAIWDTNLVGMAGAGVQEPGTLRHAELGIPLDKPYINSGVLLVNLDYWREHDVQGLLLAYIWRHPEKLRFWDQDAINACLHEQLIQLPDCWNVTHTFYLGPYRSLRGIKSEQLRNLQRDPAVVHFTGPTKPWMYIMTHPFQETYWDFLARTTFCDAVREPKTIRTILFRHLRLLHRSSKRSLFLCYSMLAERSADFVAHLSKG
jgi:lipopolysaccharide biosynthesis glycosyltransferase